MHRSPKHELHCEELWNAELSVPITKLCEKLLAHSKFHWNRQSAAELWQKRFLIWQTSAILNFKGPIMGSLKRPCRTSYKSSIETIALNCLVLRKSRFCVRILAIDRRTNRWTEPMRKGALAIASGTWITLIDDIKQKWSVNNRNFTNMWLYLEIDTNYRQFLQIINKKVII